MRRRLSRSNRIALASSFAVALAVSPVAASPPLIHDAVLDVSRLTDATLGVDELRAGVAAMRDGDPETGWVAPGDAWVLLDFTPLHPDADLAITSLEVDLDGSLAGLTLDAGDDLTRMSPSGAPATPTKTGALFTLPASRGARVLRLFVPGGARVVELRAGAAGSTPAALVDARAACEAGGVRVLWGKLPPHTRGARVVRAGVELGFGRKQSLLDATVRLAQRPATYAYEVTPIGWNGAPGAPVTITASCEGPRLSPPAPGPTHGVIEGFYGHPWPWETRAAVVRAMAALGLETYMYAPKDEPLHRQSWRTPYPESTLASFAELGVLASAVGVRFVYGISPGADVDPLSVADRTALAAKVLSLGKTGAHGAVLAFDDIPKKPTASLGAAHASLASALLSALREVDPTARLWLVPTVYAGRAPELSAGEQAYLGALSALPPDVPIAWTGRGVFSASVDAAEAAAFVALAGRGAADVWVWDNYPVNDVAVHRRLYAFPVRGRESLYPDTGGLVSNPMRHGRASIVALAGYGELARDPVGYASDRGAERPLADRALAEELAAGAAPPDGLGRFLDELVFHEVLAPDTPASPALVRALADHGSGAPGASLALATHLARLVVAEADVRRETEATALVDELDAHLRVTSAAARAALDVLAGDFAGDARLRATAACRRDALARTGWATLQTALDPLFANTAPADCDEASDALGLGLARFTARPGLAARLPAASGLPPGGTWSIVGEGATVDASGAITVLPAHVGHYRFVALYALGGHVTYRAIALDVGANGDTGEPPVRAEPEGGGCASVAMSSARAPGHGVVGGLVSLGLALAVRARRRRARSGSLPAPGARGIHLP